MKQLFLQDLRFSKPVKVTMPLDLDIVSRYCDYQSVTGLKNCVSDMAAHGGLGSRTVCPI